MEPKPTDFVSFADWLGLNQESLDALESEAADRALAKSGEAEAALGASYQEGLRSAETGGPASLGASASYGDFLRLQREAEMMRRPRGGMSPEEMAARGNMPGVELPNLRQRATQMQGNITQRSRDMATDRETRARMASEAQAARDEQAKRFAEAQESVAGWKRSKAEEERLREERERAARAKQIATEKEIRENARTASDVARETTTTQSPFPPRNPVPRGF